MFGARYFVLVISILFEEFAIIYLFGHVENISGSRGLGVFSGSRGGKKQSFFPMFHTHLNVKEKNEVFFMHFAYRQKNFVFFPEKSYITARTSGFCVGK